MMPLDHTLVSLAVITILPERMGLRYVKNESPAEHERADSPPRDHGHHYQTPQQRTNTYGNSIMPKQEDHGPTFPSRSPSASTTPTHRSMVAPCPRVQGGPHQHQSTPEPNNVTQPMYVREIIFTGAQCPEGTSEEISPLDSRLQVCGY